MKGLYKNSALLLGYHTLYSVVSLVFLLPFSSLIYYKDGVVRPLGGILYTLVMLLLYLPALYSNLWHLGRAHARKTSEVKPNFMYALKISLISEIPTYIIFVLMAVFNLKNPGSYNIFLHDFQILAGNLHRRFRHFKTVLHFLACSACCLCASRLHCGNKEL